MTPGLAKLRQITDPSEIVADGLKLRCLDQDKTPAKEREIEIASRLLFQYGRPSRYALEGLELSRRLSVLSRRECGPGISPGAAAVAALRSGRFPVLEEEEGFADLLIVVAVTVPARKAVESGLGAELPEGDTWEFRHVLWLYRNLGKFL